MNEERCVTCGEVIPEGRMVCHKCETVEPCLETVKVRVLLNSVADVSKLVELATKCRDDVVVRSGRFTVNAKSIMGLFSLDLTKPVNVEFYGNIPYEVEEGIKNFIVD